MLARRHYKRNEHFSASAAWLETEKMLISLVMTTSKHARFTMQKVTFLTAVTPEQDPTFL
jgi:hypothetical protein